MEGKSYTTDDDGFVAVELQAGQHEISVDRDGRELQREFVFDGRETHLIIDMTTRSTLELVVERLLGDRYRLCSVLGRGGMSVVFEAEDRVLNRTVAVKMLSGELEASEEAQRIFLDEARALAPLAHPNLVAIHDILSISAHTFMVLEYVVGKNLDEVLKEGPLDETTALRYCIQITRAVRFMHSKGFIHRDVKPSNAIVQEDGTVKLIDFGLARSVDRLAVRGTRVRGTPGYMAPEQILGTVLSPKVDVYQIGVTIYELLTRELPFDGDMMYGHVHMEPKFLSDVSPGASLELSRLVARCMAKDPDDRPTCDELMESLRTLYLHRAEEEDLNGVLHEQVARSKTPRELPVPEVTSTEPAPERQDVEPQTAPDKRSRAGWLVAALLLGVIITSAVFLSLRKPENAPLPPIQEPATSEIVAVPDPLEADTPPVAEQPAPQHAEALPAAPSFVDSEGTSTESAVDTDEQPIAAIKTPDKPRKAPRKSTKPRKAKPKPKAKPLPAKSVAEQKPQPESSTEDDLLLNDNDDSVLLDLSGSEADSLLLE